MLLCASLLLLGRSFFIIYVKKTAGRTTMIVAWCSLAFMVSYWSWYFFWGGEEFFESLFSKPTE
jgi:hypothetical protein